MADSLGEAFVRVIADTSSFTDSLSGGVSEALSGVSSDVEGALSGVSAVLDGVASDVSSSFDGMADDIVSSMEDAGDEGGSSLAAGMDAGAQESEAAISGLGDAIASEVEAGVDQATSALGGLADSLGSVKGALGTLIGGAGLEALARGQAPLTEKTRRLAAALDLTEDEVRALALASADVTRPLDQVLATMEIGRQQGLKSTDQLMAFVAAWDVVGDATGLSAEQLARVSPALAAVGISSDNVASAFTAFGFIQQETTMNVDEFMNIIAKIGPELRDMGLDIDDTAALLGAMEGELGLTGRRARSEFTKAVNAADGSLEEMLSLLGLTTDQMAAYRQTVQDSEGIIQRNADLFGDTFTPLQRLQHGMSELTFRFGEQMQIAGLLAAPLTALGPSMMALNATQNVLASGLGTKLRGGLRAATGAFRTLGAAILANPIFLIAAVLIGLAIVIWKFRDEIIEALVGAWDWIKEKTAALWEWLTGAFRAGVDAVVNFVTGLRDRVVDLFRRLVDGVRNLVQRWWDWYRGIWQTIFDFVRGIVDRIRDAVVGGFQRLVDGARERLTALVDFVRGIPRMILDALGNVGRMLLDAGRGIIQGLWDGMRQMWDNVTGWISGIGNRIRDLKGPLSYDRVMLHDIGEAIIGGLGRGMREEWKDVSRQLASLNTEIPMTLNPQMTGAVGQLTAFAGTPSRGVEIQMTINNPTPEPASTSATREMRKLAALGVFDA